MVPRQITAITDAVKAYFDSRSAWVDGDRYLDSVMGYRKNTGLSFERAL